MLGFMPSEIARLVLGYLQETVCEQAMSHFLKECRHIQEYAQCLEVGLEYPTTIEGRGLQTMMQDYYTLTHLDLGSSVENQLLISNMEGSVNRVKILLNDYKSLTSSQKSRSGNVVKVVRPALQNAKTASSLIRLKQKRCLRRYKKAESLAKDIVPNPSRLIQKDQKSNTSLSSESRIPSLENSISMFGNSVKLTETTQIPRLCQDGIKSANFSIDYSKSSLGNRSCSINIKKNSKPITSEQCDRSSLVNETDNINFVNIQKHKHSISEQPISDNVCSTSNRSNFRVEASRTCLSQTTQHRSTSPYVSFVFRSNPGITDPELNEDRVSNTSDAQSSTRDSSLLKSDEHYFQVPLSFDIHHVKNSLTNPVTISPVEPGLKSRTKMPFKLSALCSHSSSSTCRADCPTSTECLNVENKRVHVRLENGGEPIMESTIGFSPCNSPLNLVCEKDHPVSQIAYNNYSNRERPKDIPVIDLDSSQSSFPETPKKHFLEDRSQAVSMLRECPESNIKSTENSVLSPATATSESTVPIAEDENAISSIFQPEDSWKQIGIEKERLKNSEQLKASSPFPQSEVEKDSPKLRRSPRISAKSILPGCHSGGTTSLRKTPSLVVSSPKVNLQSPLVTPLNSVEPELPERYSSDQNSPRFVLSQQRSDFLIPSLTTPVKQYHQAIINQIGLSPKRKSQIPRRRLMSSPSVRSLLQSPTSKTVQTSGLSPFKTADGFMDFTFLDELINCPPFIEKLTENINRVKGIESHTRVILEENKRLSSEMSKFSLETPDMNQEIQLPDSVIKDILHQTESDPIFEDVLNMLCEKQDFKKGTDDAAKGCTLNESLNNSICFENSPASHKLQSPVYNEATVSIPCSPAPSLNVSLPELASSVSLPSTTSNATASVSDLLHKSIAILTKNLPTRNAAKVNVPLIPVPTFTSAIVNASSPSSISEVSLPSPVKSISTLSTNSILVAVPIAIPTTASTVAPSESVASEIAFRYPSPKKDLLQRTLEGLDLELNPEEPNPLVVAEATAPSSCTTLDSAVLGGTCIQVLNQPIMSTKPSNTLVMNGSPVKLQFQNGVNILTFPPGQFYTQAMSDIFMGQGKSPNKNQVTIQPRPENNKVVLKKVTLGGLGHRSRLTSARRKYTFGLTENNHSQQAMAFRNSFPNTSSAEQSIRLASHVRSLDFGTNTPVEWTVQQPSTADSDYQNFQTNSETNGTTVQYFTSSPGPSNGVVYINAFGQQEKVSTINLSELDLLRDSSSSSSKSPDMMVPNTQSATDSSKKKRKLQASPNKKFKVAITTKKSKVTPNKSKTTQSKSNASPKKSRTTSKKKLTQIPKKSAEKKAVKIKWDYTRDKKGKTKSPKDVENSSTSGSSEPPSQELLKEMNIERFLSTVHKEK